MYKENHYMIFLFSLLAVFFTTALQGINLLMELDVVEKGMGVIFTLAILYDFYVRIKNTINGVATETSSFKKNTIFILHILLLCFIIYDIYSL